MQSVQQLTDKMGAARISEPAAAAPKHSNLYVASLPASIDSENALRALFAPYGAIESCRLVRNNRDGKSFAFVKYSSIPEALAGIAGLHGVPVGEAVLEVKSADADAGDRNPELLAPPSDNLYAKNLPKELTEDELRALFSPYGSVIECRVLHSGTQRDSGAGAGALVRMASVEEASQAIAHLHNQRLAGCSMPLVVRYADSQEQKAKKAARQHKRFEQQGRYGGSGGGSGPHSPAYGMPHHHEVAGYHHPPPQHHPAQHHHPQQPPPLPHPGYYSPVHPGPSPPYAAQQASSSSVYIKYLPEQTDRLWLYEKFAPYGAVLSVRVLTTDAGLCRGVGFINYGDPEAAARAVQAMNGMPVGGDRRLYVALQTPRSGGPPR